MNINNTDNALVSVRLLTKLDLLEYIVMECEILDILDKAISDHKKGPPITVWPKTKRVTLFCYKHGLGGYTHLSNNAIKELYGLSTSRLSYEYSRILKAIKKYIANNDIQFPKVNETDNGIQFDKMPAITVAAKKFLTSSPIGSFYDRRSTTNFN